MRMKTGKYYIGDPCYVVEDQNDWIKLLEDTNYFENKNQSYKGQPIYCGGTAYGDGCYESNKGKCYGVDAGLLGIMPVEVIDIPETEAEFLGSIETFDKDFDVEIGKGLFIFGDIIIDTRE
ncbi:MAG: hypothetical protein GX289_07650 [Tissierellia bacterium]|jgi:hypothetical protein|nr:hypothetical protein [Tissierellia bacterium]